MDANTQRRIDADYEYTRSQYADTDKWMKAPNGQPTNLTERQWVQVRTPAFKEWFMFYCTVLRNSFSMNVQKYGNVMMLFSFPTFEAQSFMPLRIS